MLNKTYIRKKQLEELDFLLRHMEPEDKVKYLRDLRFHVKHRTLGSLHMQLKKVMRFLAQ